MLHVMIEGIIENQLHSQVGVLEVFSKLQKEDNLTPHAARACIANVFLQDFSAMLVERQPFNQESFVRRLHLIGTDVSIPFQRHASSVAINAVHRTPFNILTPNRLCLPSWQS